MQLTVFLFRVRTQILGKILNSRKNHFAINSQIHLSRFPLKSISRHWDSVKTKAISVGSQSVWLSECLMSREINRRGPRQQQSANGLRFRARASVSRIARVKTHETLSVQTFAECSLSVLCRNQQSSCRVCDVPRIPKSVRCRT